MSKDDRPTIVVVGQTPPPIGGQAVMIEAMLRGKHEKVRLHHVRMAFSTEMDQIGRFRVRKLFELVRVIARIVHARFVLGARVLYYPPGGSTKLPLLRDFVILISTRWLFRKTIFHFHASGLGRRQDELSPPMRWLFRRAYYDPDVGIRLSELAPQDAEQLRAKRQYIVPNGIEDAFPSYAGCRAERSATPPTILYAGVLCETKGVEVLLRACSLLAERDVDFRLELMGMFESEAFESRVAQAIRRNRLEDRVRLLGVLSGDAKFKTFASADLFCFPTFFPSETFSVVLVEALSFGLPVVTTDWRGIPSIVEDGRSGFVVPIKDEVAVADRLQELIENPALRESMGRSGRDRYVSNFTVERFHDRLDGIFTAATAAG